jgi:hypothetical protein
LKVDRVLSFRPLQGPCVTGGDRPLARGRLHVTSLALAR